MAALQAVNESVNNGRDPLVRRGIRLNYLTIGYNTVEAIVSLAAGIVAGSVALVSFGVDSAIEVTSAGAALIRRPSYRQYTPGLLDTVFISVGVKGPNA